MSETNQSPDLNTLENDYHVVGEVRGPGGMRAYTATRKDAGVKRRDDQSGVLITVVTTPEGDEGNALSHLAADTKLLAGMSHRRLIPVVEGRWVGTDAFAVVTQRTTDSSLEQRLAQGETFSTPRVAAILREVNGLLEWAREHKVVHRNITTERIFLEPRTDRVRVTFGVAPIIRLKHVDPETEDARTIVRLAVSMLTGSEDPSNFSGKTLTELRPDLPDQLQEATVALLDETKPHTAADVASYLALVSMAGPLAAGETEAERIRDETLGEQLAEREKLAEERTTFEQDAAREKSNFERVMAEAREAFDKLMADERATFAKEKDDTERRLAKEKADLERRLATEKDELQRAATLEREAIVAKRAELERTVAEQRMEMERAAAEDRRQIDVLRAEIKRAGEQEVERKREAALDEITDAESTLERPAYATPLFIPPPLPALEELAFDDDTALMRDTEEAPVVEPMTATEEAALPPEILAERNAAVAAAAGGGGSKRTWPMPAGIAAFVAVLAAGALTVGRREPAAPVATTSAPGTKATVAPISSAPVLEPPTVPLPDSATVAATDSVVRADSVLEAAARRRRRIVRDSIARARDAEVARRDSLAKRDSARPDTLPD
ncbi:MAG: protein kinase [bacterium]